MSLKPAKKSDQSTWHNGARTCRKAEALSYNRKLRKIASTLKGSLSFRMLALLCWGILWH